MPRKSEIGATRRSYVYQVRVPESLRLQWDQYCQKKNDNPSRVLRALMRYMIQDEFPTEVQHWIARQVEGEPDYRPKERMEVRLTPSEHQCILKRAENEGCSPQRWVVNCVRASLTNEPQFTMETTKALWESSYQLMAIGRNLNQIAKRLNEGRNTIVRAEQVERLSSYIHRHTDKVSAVQDASLSRWRITHEND